MIGHPPLQVLPPPSLLVVLVLVLVLPIQAIKASQAPTATN